MNHPNYKHRTLIGVSDTTEDFDLTDLNNCVCLSTEQASAIIMQMQSQFLGDRDRLSDADNFTILDVIRKELLDIEILMKWYFDQSKEVKNHD